MQITIRSVLGVERADIQVSPLALLAGLNGASKTSALTAIASALTGVTMPCGLPKKESKVIVRDGADAGRVTVKGDDGHVIVSWPKAEATTEGTAPHASQIAAGIASPLDMDEKERAKTLAKYLKSNPTVADLAQALRDSESRFVIDGVASGKEAEAMRSLSLDGLDNRDTAIYRAILAIWPEVEVSGFDGAHAKATQVGQELKASWRAVTGEAYGAAKAPGWQHKDAAQADGLVPDGKDPATHLAERVAYHKNVAEATIRNAAVAAMDLDGLRAKAAKVADFTAAASQAKTQKDRLSAEYDVWIIQKAPPTVPDVPMACPHCSAAVVVENGALVAVSHAPDPAEIKTAQAALLEYTNGREAAKIAFDTAAHTYRSAEESLKEAKLAEAKLGEMSKAPAATEDDVEKAKATVTRFERALLAVRQKSEADRLHKHVVANQAMIDVLAADGLRKQKLGKVLESFNESRLAPLCQAAKWGAVTIGLDLEIRYGGRLAREPFVSESQVMRTRIVLQVALAQIDKSSCILIDRADKLDPKGRNGLFGLLSATKVPAIVAMTMAKPELMPDLAKAGVGEAYWIKDGVAILRSEAVQAPVPQAAE